MSFETQLEKVEHAVSAGMHEVYSGLNRPDYDVPPHLGGDSPQQINWLAVLILVSVCLSLGLGWILDSRCRGALMEGRPHFWAILLLCASYLLLIPGLINPVFSFSIVINIIGHRKNVEPEAGHPVCTETTTGLAHLLWKTGSRIGAFFIILFSMVIPALELIMLVFGEIFRFASARFAEVFRFAYVLLVDLVRTLDQEPLILSRARLALCFVPLFVVGLRSPCMSFHIETKQLFPPYGPLPESARTVVDILDLKHLLRSETSIISCVADYFARLHEWEANTFISLTLILGCVVGSTVLDMLSLVLAALRLSSDKGYASLSWRYADAEHPTSEIGQRTPSCYWIAIARIARKLSMLDVAMVGVYLVTVCMSMYAKYGVVVSLEHGMLILLGAECIHAFTYYLVDSAYEYHEDSHALNLEALRSKTDQASTDVAPSYVDLGCCASHTWPKIWRILQLKPSKF